MKYLPLLKMQNKNRNGFTLIELLVVIVIVGILSTISVAQFRSSITKARDAERLSAINTLSTLITTGAGDRSDCGLYNYAGGTDVSASNNDDCEIIAEFDDLLTDNDYEMPEVKQGLHYYYGFKLGETEGRNDFFVAVAAEQESPQGALDVNEDSSVPAVYIFADGTSGGIDSLYANRSGGSGCKVSGGYIRCDNDWTLYEHGMETVGWKDVTNTSIDCVPGTAGCKEPEKENTLN